MKEQVSKKGSKQIICIIVMIMLCNFIVPNYSYAAETKKGGDLFVDIAQFLCFIPDAVINYLQDIFVSPQDIKRAEENYEILYSPGTIFAGQIPAFDINFINPMDKKEVSKEVIDNFVLDDIKSGKIGQVFSRLKQNPTKVEKWYSYWRNAE